MNPTTKKVLGRLRDLHVQAGVYAMWSQVDAWLAIGNDAAHGNCGNYSSDEVKAMLASAAVFAERL